MLEVIKSIDLKSWMGLAGVLVGALLGLAGVFIANRSSHSRLQLQLENERQRNHSQVKREKLEELYILLGHWVNILFGHYLKLILVMRGEIDYNQYLDEAITANKESKVDFQRLEMILYIYGRELIPLYEIILECRGKVNNIAAIHRSDYDEGKSGEKYIGLYTTAHTELENAVESLKREIADLAVSA